MLMQIDRYRCTVKINSPTQSKQYDSQYWERPGMAKYLKELSDNQWEEGLDTLKKYMQRGGKIDDFRGKVNVNAKVRISFFREQFQDFSVNN